MSEGHTFSKVFLSHDVKKSTKGKCFRCGECVGSRQVFCVSCGERNVRFSLKALKKHFGFQSVEEAVELGCPEWHSIIPHKGSTTPELFEEMKDAPFCAHCGMDTMLILMCPN